MYLLDTNVVSELRKTSADRHVRHWVSRLSASVLYISAITLLELEKGVLLVERRDNRQGKALRAWLTNHVLTAFTNRIVPFDSTTAVRCATLLVPNSRPDRDAMIAATALVQGFVVVTRNVDDFAGCGARVINPFAAVPGP